MRKNLKMKFDQASEISIYESEPCRVKAKNMKVTSKSLNIRNKTVANLIRNELQASYFPVMILHWSNFIMTYGGHMHSMSI